VPNSPLKIEYDIKWQGLLDQIKAFSPRKSGRLAESWSIIEETPTSVTIQSDSPEAQMQDIGGWVPPVTGKLMVWQAQTGETVFAMSRRGFMLKGSHYTARADDAWFTELGREG
jgi:hypothetical protein